MSGSISVGDIVNIVPGVLSAGGTALDLNGMLLSDNPQLPMGQALSFSSPGDVSAYLGFGSNEYNLSQDYFSSFDNSDKKPGALYIVRYNKTPVAGFLRGYNISGLTLPQLQTISGALNVTVDGTLKTGNINLSTATSFSAAAGLIATALGVACAYNSLSGGLVITSGTTGAASSLTYATGAAAAALGLTLQGGATLSPGADSASPAAFMQGLLALVSNWACFTTSFEPPDADKLAFAVWNDAQGARFVYVAWDSNVAPSVGPATSSFGYLTIKLNTYNGVYPVYADVHTAMSVLGYAASLDFGQTEGRKNVAFRKGSNLTPVVTSSAVKNNLIANGYNFFGRFATANDSFNFHFNGQVGGDFSWLDSYVNQIWMNNQFQLALITLLMEAGTIPYNTEGYTMIETACLQVINAAINFGAIRAGVTLSTTQASIVNSDAGAKVSDIITQQGWYMYVKDAQPQVRAARQSPPIKFWYADGQSIQAITMPSIQIQ